MNLNDTKPLVPYSAIRLSSWDTKRLKIGGWVYHTCVLLKIPAVCSSCILLFAIICLWRWGLVKRSWATSARLGLIYTPVQMFRCIVCCRGLVQLGGPVFRYYRVVPPNWGLASSVLFTILTMSYKLKNTWLIFLIILYFTSLFFNALPSSKVLCFRYP